MDMITVMSIDNEPTTIKKGDILFISEISKNQDDYGDVTIKNEIGYIKAEKENGEDIFIEYKVNSPEYEPEYISIEVMEWYSLPYKKVKALKFLESELSEIKQSNDKEIATNFFKCEGSREFIGKFDNMVDDGSINQELRSCGLPPIDFINIEKNSEIGEFVEMDIKEIWLKGMDKDDEAYHEQFSEMYNEMRKKAIWHIRSIIRNNTEKIEKYINDIKDTCCMEETKTIKEK